jgi:hypothetical protein
MRKTLKPNTWTQVNTKEDDYLIQNLGSYAMHLIVSGTQPATEDEPDFIIDSGYGFGSMHAKGVCWCKPEGNVSIIVGVVEG